jgi:RNA polymerase sigma-70 factor, ECF subfamily
MLKALPASTLTAMDSPSSRTVPSGERPGVHRVDSASRKWLQELRDDGAVRDEAIGRLHVLLLKAARFEVARRRRLLPHIRGGDFDDIANQAADDALVAVLTRLDAFRGESRFTTWAYKFALLEAAVKLRRRAWQGREIPMPESGDLELLPGGGPSPQEALEQRELIVAVRETIAGELTSHQRDVFVALALNGVPIDVLAERLGTTRGALYKTLHDARQKLRGELMRRGFALSDHKVAR